MAAITLSVIHIMRAAFGHDILAQPGYIGTRKRGILVRRAIAGLAACFCSIPVSIVASIRNNTRYSTWRCRPGYFVWEVRLCAGVNRVLDQGIDLPLWWLVHFVLMEMRSVSMVRVGRVGVVRVGNVSVVRVGNVSVVRVGSVSVVRV